MRHDLEVGTYQTDNHYAVIGEPTNFYVWVREGKSAQMVRGQGWSGWITGSKGFAIYNRLRTLHRKDRDGFVQLIKQLRKEYDKEAVRQAQQKRA